MEKIPTLPVLELSDPKALIHQYLQAFERLVSRTCLFQRRTGMHIEGEAKYVQITFPKGFDRTLEIVGLGDVQFGNRRCRLHRLEEYRDWILSKPNRFLVLLGDMIDAWALWSPGSPFEQLMDPQGQVFQFCETMAPIVPRILGNVGGNHERRARKDFGDTGRLIAALLKLPYSGGQQLIDVHFGNHQPFKIHLWHGAGGARTKGGIAQKLDTYSRNSNSDIFMMAHLHQGMIVPDFKCERVPGKRDVHIQKIVSCLGTSFLSYWGSYAEVAGFRIGDVMMPRIVLEATGEWSVVLK